MMASTIGAEAVEGLVLHAHDTIACSARQQPLGNELLAAKADDHDLAAEVRVHREVLQRADRHDRQRRVDGDAAAVIVRQPDDVVDIGIFRQQLGLDALDRKLAACRRRTARSC